MEGSFTGIKAIGAFKCPDGAVALRPLLVDPFFFLRGYSIESHSTLTSWPL